jgi:molybdate transport system ATP-binding protein
MTLHACVRVDRAGFCLDVDLTAAGGETVAVLGPNGAGKSTLLGALAGLIPLSAGRVELGPALLDDVPTGRRVPVEQRRIAVVFQEYRLFPHLSARENVAFGPRSTGTAKQAARAEAEAWLSRLGLDGVADVRPAQLSGGQAQRVALARALCRSPELLLLDEPLSSLDVATRSDVRSVLRDLLAEFAGPALLVTHDPIDALALADRLVVLEQGAVVQSGTPAEVARRPASPYVAKLVGLNLFRGTASHGVVHVDGGGVLTTDSALEGPVLAVVRPSSVLLDRSEPIGSSARNRWVGRLGSLEATGDRVRISVTSTPPLLVDVTPQAVADLRLIAGDEVWASLKATDVDVYPAPAGRV